MNTKQATETTNEGVAVRLHSGSVADARKVARLLHFGRGGHTAYFSDLGPIKYSNCHLSGYEDPESFCALYQWWAHPRGEMSSHWHDLSVPDDGIPVVDVRGAVETPAGMDWVFRGPMVDPDLPDGAADELCAIDPMMAGAMAGNAFGQLAAFHTAQRASGARRGSLDSVSVREYVDGWREHGARIGRAFRNADGSARIVWEN
jgi:hypothetical protein